MFIVIFNKGTATALAVADTRQPSVRRHFSVRVYCNRSQKT